MCKLDFKSLQCIIVYIPVSDQSSPDTYFKRKSFFFLVVLSSVKSTCRNLNQPVSTESPHFVCTQIRGTCMFVGRDSVLLYI